ncbi:CysS/YqeB C-terminal domain-containing protein, partial [Streptomyces regalis]|uniref:CysS/YqeB C-terminal domain-containing protein n=1 Tax=Streptomyces regalis TaxID=68262 RepID=UPI000AAE8A96
DTLVRMVLDQREAARSRKDWATADAIRDQLNQSGLVIEDSPQHGPRWRRAVDTPHAVPATAQHTTRGTHEP